MNAILWYKSKSAINPLKAKAVSGSVIFFLGDLLCQSLEIHVLKVKENYDFSRACIQGSFGFIINPYTYYQYNIFIPKIFPANRKYSLVKSIAYSVTLNDAIFNLSFFFYMNMLKKKTQRVTLSDLPEKFIPVQLANMKIYPFITGVNFYFIPASFRVLFDNIATIFWNVYLSYVEHQS
jgi:hypothetical protein